MKKVAVGGISLMMLIAASTGIHARIREGRVLQVKAGITRSEVERLLGPGEPDVMGFACEDCPSEREQFAYRANPSLW